MSGFRQLLLHEASTRSAALIRIGLALLLWARFGRDVALFEHPEPRHWGLALAFYASTTGLLIGLWSRWSAAAAGATLLYMVYGMGPDVMEPWTHHHTTLLAHATALVALTPCGHSYSVDRWLHPERPERGPTWGLTLIAVQVTVLYLSTALDKCTWAFLSGERLQHTFQLLYWGADPVTVPGWEPLMAVLAVATVLLEAALPVGLWSRRARPWLIPAGIALHVAIYVLMPVATFTLTMILLYLAFLDPDDVHAAIDRLQRAPD